MTVEFYCMECYHEWEAEGSPDTCPECGDDKVTLTALAKLADAALMASPNGSK